MLVATRSVSQSLRLQRIFQIWANEVAQIGDHRLGGELHLIDDDATLALMARASVAPALSRATRQRVNLAGEMTGLRRHGHTITAGLDIAVGIHQPREKRADD